MADATDLKSVGFSMRVRVPPRAFRRNRQNAMKHGQKHAGAGKSSKKRAFFPETHNKPQKLFVNV